MSKILKAATKLAPYINIIAKGTAAFAGIAAYLMVEQPVNTTINIALQKFLEKPNLVPRLFPGHFFIVDSTILIGECTILIGDCIKFIITAPFRLIWGAVSTGSKACATVATLNSNSLSFTENTKTILFITKDIVTGKLAFGTGTGSEVFLFASALTIQIGMGLITLYITYRFVKWVLNQLLQKLDVKHPVLTTKKQDLVTESEFNRFSKKKNIFDIVE